MVRLDPDLIGLEVDRCLELPGTGYKNEFRGRPRRQIVSPCVIVASSSYGQMCGLFGRGCRPQDRSESSLEFIVVIPIVVV